MGGKTKKEQRRKQLCSERAQTNEEKEKEEAGIFLENQDLIIFVSDRTSSL
jgi:hypothetical protein